MPSLSKAVLRTIEKYAMLEPGERVVAAVSGGPDSAAMLHALNGLSGELGITLAVAHLDHGLRHESADEADFVRKMAEDLGVPFFTEKARLKESLLESPENKQAAARRVRYEFLEKVRREFQAQKIAVGHTADDQAETWLMRLLRGSGARGLSAIPPVRGSIIRPLIEATREQVNGYVEEKNIPFVTDPSNLKPDYLRNRLRMELMPLLKEYNPEVVSALCRSAEILRDEDNFLDAYAREIFTGLLREERDGSIELDRAAFSGLHPAVRRRVLRLAIGWIKGDPMAIEFQHILKVEELAASGKTGKFLDLPGGIRIETSYGDIRVGLKRERLDYEINLPVPGRLEIPEAGITVEAVLGAIEEPVEEGIDTARFDMASLKAPLVVRNRRPGDAFYPQGMEGRKKLQDFFVDKKIPREQRDRLPLLVSGDEILWVMGMRQDRRFIAGPDAGKILSVKAKRKGGA